MSDAASEALAAVRAERQANKERLRAEVEGWARQLQQKGAAEAGAVSLIRGRFCIGVRVRRAEPDCCSKLCCWPVVVCLHPATQLS